MQRPPRKRGSDRIFTWSMLLYAYGYMGVCMSVAVWLTAKSYLESNGLSWGQWFYSWTNINYVNGDDPANQAPGIRLSPTEVFNLFNETGSIIYIIMVGMQFGNILTTRYRTKLVLPMPAALQRWAQRRVKKRDADHVNPWSLLPHVELARACTRTRQERTATPRRDASACL
jgi:hypothetical protein